MIDRLITIDAIDIGIAILALLLFAFVLGYFIGYEARGNKR